MLKKLLLLLCLASLVAWAAPSKGRKASMKKKAAPVAEKTVEAPAASTDADDGFMSAPDTVAPLFMKFEWGQVLSLDMLVVAQAHRLVGRCYGYDW